MGVGFVRQVTVLPPETHNVMGVGGFSQQIVTRKGRVILEIEMESAEAELMNAGRQRVIVALDPAIETFQPVKPPCDAPKQAEDFW